MHVVPEIGRIDESGGRPFALGTGHGNRVDVFLVRHKGFRQLQSFDLLVRFSDPMESKRTGFMVAQCPFGAGRQLSVAAGIKRMGGAPYFERCRSFNHEQYCFRANVCFGTVRSSVRTDLHYVLGKRFSKSA